MAAIFECQECGHQAVYEQEDGLTRCPKCSDIHVDVVYGVPSYVSFRGTQSEECAYCGTTTENHIENCLGDGIYKERVRG